MVINLNFAKRLVIILFFIIVLIHDSNKELFASEEKDKQNNNSSLNLDFKKIKKEVEQDFNKENELIAKKRKLLIEQIDHEIWKIEFIEKSFEWQFASNFIILIIVIIIITVGLYFSYIQFTKSLIKDNENPDYKEIKETTIKFGTGEIEISSSVIGLIILTLSFAFFYFCILPMYFL